MFLLFSLEHEENIYEKMCHCVINKMKRFAGRKRLLQIIFKFRDDKKERNEE